MTHKSIPFAFPDNCKLLTWTQIDQADRCRKNYGDLNDMIESFKRVGLLHPPTVVETSEGVYKLAGGGRRLATMNSMGCKLYPVNVRESNTDATIAEMELFENLDRMDMRWDEKVLTIEKAHRLHLKAAADLGSNWGCRETGKIVGRSAVHVSHALKVAPYIKNNDLEIIEAPSLLDAYTILLRRAEERADSVRVSQIKKTAATRKENERVSAASPKTGANISIDDIGGDDMASVFGDSFGAPEVVDGPAPVDKTFFDGRTDFPLSEWIRRANSVTEGMPSMSDESVDHIITDPPYGINISEEYLADPSSITDQHEVKANIKMFDPMIEQFYRVLRPHGYCIIWIDVSHYERMMKLCKKVGFKPQVHPFIWHKTHAVKNMAAQTNFTKVYEMAIVLRKGNAQLKLTGPPAFVSADASIERRMYSNPFAKPYEVWKSLIVAVSDPGQIILDPYAGNMSCPRACLNLGREPRAFEIEEHHFNKGYSILTDFIKEMTNGKGTVS